MGYFKSVKERDPAARNWLQILLLYPGVKALIYYRIAHFFYKIKLKFIFNFYFVCCSLLFKIVPPPKKKEVFFKLPFFAL